MTAFWIALFFVFIAEMGDKTQIVALAFATRYAAKTVLAGVFVATLLIHLFSVLIGEAAALALPVIWVKLFAGLSFIFYGLWTLRGDSSDDDGKKLTESRFGPLMTVGISCFLAEIGDKTMLATVTIASEQKSFAGVWIGGALGMVIADGIAIIIGKTLGKKLPENLIRYGAALIFLVSGAGTLAEVWRYR
ncbi:MAG: TMEM165/GDT1 family protein [Chloracidobacterium sp.]|nr:TMEM165/GDT1 family protein [Chloracidobacterium sp.]